jgi:peptide/nickel transport system substrate-binding protein
MKKLRWPLLIALLSLVVIAFLLWSQKPTILQPLTGEPEVQPAQGGIYTEGLTGALMRLNPLLDYYNQADRDVDRLIFSGLLRFDDRGLPQADLSDSWGISRDGLLYNFSIRAKANWHDGQPVTSDDVIFTIDMLRDDAAPIPNDLREFWKQIDVKRLDDKTVQFRLPEAFSPFMDYLTVSILPEHILGGMTIEEIIDAPFNLQPVGSGPYRFERLIVEGGQIKGVLLSANEDFYNQTAFVEQIAFRYYPDGAAALAAYQAGEISGIGTISNETLPAVLQEANLKVYTSRLPDWTLVFLNLDNPNATFFQDGAVRKALLMGLNRQRMIDTLLQGQAFLSDGPIMPGSWAYFAGVERINYDANAAVAMLVEAGYTIPAEGGTVRTNAEGTKLSFALVYPDEPLYQGIADALQRDWAQIGVEAKLNPLPYEELVSSYLDTRQYQAALVNLSMARTPDPDPYPFWHQSQITGGQNYSQWDDRQASEYLEQARLVTDPAERTRLYNNFQVRWSQELPALPLFYPVYNYAVSSDVQGVSIGPLFDPADRFANLMDWFLLTRRGSEETATPEVTTTAVP